MGSVASLAAAFLALALAACGSIAPREAPQSAAQPQALLASPVRTERERRMDGTRHPLELLQFAEVAGRVARCGRRRRTRAPRSRSGSPRIRSRTSSWRSVRSTTSFRPPGVH